MIIRLCDVPGTGRWYRGEAPADIVDLSAEGGPRLVAPLTYAVKATRLPGMLLIMGELASRAELRCVRCDVTFVGDVGEAQFERSWELTLDGLQWIRRTDEDPPEEVMDQKVAEARRPVDPVVAAHDCVDLTEEMREAIILAFPGYPVCRADCKGLCPACGVNLNEAACRCAPPDDNRWALLNRWAPGSRRS